MNTLVYVGDPMCSWCYGFAPTISKIHHKFKGLLKFRLVTGGLYTGRTTFQDERRIEFLRQTWSRIAEISGQQFDFSILDTSGWLYDTELSCRAVVAMRRLNEGLVFDYFHKIQENFYMNGMDTQAEETFSKAAAALGVDENVFIGELQKTETVEETLADFAWSRQMGVGGFPALLFNDESRWSFLSSGYQEFNVLDNVLSEITA